MNIRIGEHWVGEDTPPFIVAEMSGNHNQSLDRAIAIVEAAAKSGVHAVKLQTYTADTMTIDIKEREFYIDDPSSLWAGRSLYDLYQEAYTPWEWHKEIFNRCAKLGIECFSTPFDSSAVDFLESLNVPAYKVASFENYDHKLIKKIASTGKPIIISSGMASLSEFSETVALAKDYGIKDLILLKCTTSYPATPENSNIRTIPHMKQMYGCQVGLSDHTLGIGVAVASVALGATFIEKHFTLDRSEGGVDAEFSLEPQEFKNLTEESLRAWQGLGEIKYGSSSDKEARFRTLRRSLYVIKDMKAGEVLEENDVKAIRPGLGLPTKYLETFLGKRLNQDVARGTPLSFDFIG